jgi:hypothetical protein
MPTVRYFDCSACRCAHGCSRGDLRERLARSLERHRHLDAGFLLEFDGGETAPFGLHRADDVELILGQRGGAAGG